MPDFKGFYPVQTARTDNGWNSKHFFPQIKEIASAPAVKRPLPALNVLEGPIHGMNSHFDSDVFGGQSKCVASSILSRGEGLYLSYARRIVPIFIFGSL
jgi:hypothetical protein